MRVIISGSAAAYLRNEIHYLKSRSPMAATRFANAMAEARRNLEAFPDLGKGGVESLIPGCRTWVVGDYLMDYLHKSDVIEIVSIRHGRMGPLVPPRDPDHDFE